MAKSTINDIRAFAKKEYKRATKKPSEFDKDMNQVDHDENGFIVLYHNSELPVNSNTDLVTDLSALEQRLDAYREKTEAKREQARPEESFNDENKPKKEKKLDKKSKKKLLKSIFNNADNLQAAKEANSDKQDEEEKVEETTLETTYGKRYAPLVTMVYDLIGEYDDIADDIKNDLATRPNMKTMYRSSQISNLLTAKNSKFAAIKELTSIAKQITDLEYKKEKDNKSDDVSDEKAIIGLTARYLRGSLDDSGYDDMDDSPKSGKKDKKKKKNKVASVAPSSNPVNDEPREPKKKDIKGYISTAKVEKMAGDLEDEDEADDSELANALGKALMKHKDELSFTAYEKHINMEGKYTLAVLADADKPSSNWKFIAVDKDGKEIKGFKDKYGDLVPKKSECHMSFNVAKMRVVDKNTSITYKLYLK